MHGPDTKVHGVGHLNLALFRRASSTVQRGHQRLASSSRETKHLRFTPREEQRFWIPAVHSKSSPQQSRASVRRWSAANILVPTPPPPRPFLGNATAFSPREDRQSRRQRQSLTGRYVFAALAGPRLLVFAPAWPLCSFLGRIGYTAAAGLTRGTPGHSDEACSRDQASVTLHCFAFPGPRDKEGLVQPASHEPRISGRLPNTRPSPDLAHISR